MNDVKKPSLPEMIAWHREQAKKELKEAAWRQSYADRDPPGYGEHDSHAFHAEKHRATSAHHEAAAEALEALAVPGVAELLTMLAQDGACVTAGIGGEYPDDAQRAALATLAKIGSER